MPAPARRQTDRKGFIGWLGRPTTNLSVAVLFVSLCVLFGLMAAAFTDLAHRLSKDESSTCAIQSRGLKATPFLIGYLTDLHAITTIPPDKATRRREAQLPPKQLHLELALLHSLNANLAAYLKIEKGQPKTRHCS